MDLQSLLSVPGCHIHFVGIGGVSMAQLAELLHQRGYIVTGSDAQDSRRVQELMALGIAVSLTHDGSLMGNARAVVRSAAIRDDNAEVLQAKGLAIPVLERADILGAITGSYEYSVCIAGTHGKTTTTSMLTHIASTADRSPTAFIGARTPTQPKGFCVGASNLIITESCEYYNSFLKFFPKICVILNIEYDHKDFFTSFEQLLSSFRQFAERTPPDGIILANGACANTRKALAGMAYKTFGTSETDDIRAVNIAQINGFPCFDVVINGQLYTHLALTVPGEYNLLNALAAAGVAHMLGISGGDVAAAMQSFQSAERRMEQKGQVNGAWVYDDYAHHPTAVRQALQAVRDMGFKTVRLVFQPHLYSRTHEMLHEFAEALKGADEVIIADIYAARETNTWGVSSQALADLIPNARAISSFEEIAATLRREAQPGDLLLTMGAGDVYKIADLLVKPLDNIESNGV